MGGSPMGGSPWTVPSWAVPRAWLWQVLAGVSSLCPGGVDVHPASWVTQRDVSLRLAAAPSAGASPCTGVRGGCAAGCTHPAGGAPGPGSPCGSGLLSELGGGPRGKKGEPQEVCTVGQKGWAGIGKQAWGHGHKHDTDPGLHGTTLAPNRGARSGVFSPVLFHENTG